MSGPRTQGVWGCGSVAAPKGVRSLVRTKRVEIWIRDRTQGGWGLGRCMDPEPKVVGGLGPCPEPNGLDQRGGVLGRTQASSGWGCVRTQGCWGLSPSVSGPKRVGVESRPKGVGSVFGPKRFGSVSGPKRVGFQVRPCPNPRGFGGWGLGLSVFGPKRGWDGGRTQWGWVGVRAQEGGVLGWIQEG